MEVCLIGYVDNTEENKRMLDTYELRNDFWAENFKFRRKDEPVSKWKDGYPKYDK